MRSNILLRYIFIPFICAQWGIRNEWIGLPGHWPFTTFHTASNLKWKWVGTFYTGNIIKAYREVGVHPLPLLAHGRLCWKSQWVIFLLYRLKEGIVLRLDLFNGILCVFSASSSCSARARVSPGHVEPGPVDRAGLCAVSSGGNSSWIVQSGRLRPSWHTNYFSPFFSFLPFTLS